MASRSLSVAAALLLLAAGCGSDDEPQQAGSPLTEPAATEASPEAPPSEAAEGPLSADDEQRVAAATRAYIAAINADDGPAVCAAFAAGTLEDAELPRSRGGCPASVQASIGFRGPGGTPAWKRTTIRELKAVSVGDDSARVTATVTHDFADRNYTSVEEDVIYLERSGEEWLIAKPSGSFYRAIGYPEPPLRALTPP
jgi:hypothetical protein